MDEEKKIKKNKELDGSKQEENIESLFSTSKKETKKAYVVICVTPANVTYRISADNCGFTKNIWENKLKPGDQIYL